MVTSVDSERSAVNSIWNAAFDDPLVLADRYYELLALGPDELERQLAKIASVEHALPEVSRYAATKVRLLAWLQLSAEDRRIIVRSFERAVSRLPSAVQASRDDAERAVTLNGLTCRQFRELAGLLSWCAEELMPDSAA